MRLWLYEVALGIGVLSGIANASTAQVQTRDTTSLPIGTVRTFLDCPTIFCDFDHIRREVPFVRWVLDRRDADVHVLATTRDIGGGGQEHTIVFIGTADLANRTDTLLYFSRPTDTESEIRDGLVRTIQLGLIPYVAKTAIAERLSVTYLAPTEGTVSQEDDPWNLWIFTVSVSGDFNAERDQRFVAGSAMLGANRTAEDWKLDIKLSGALSRDETDVPDLDTTFVNSQERFTIGALAVRSVGERWAAGVQLAVAGSNFINTDLGVQGGPSVEFSLYPYAESTRRKLTFLYTVGVAVFDYQQETVFGETSEIRPIHILDVSLAIVQPWGTANASAVASQFLHDPSKHRIDFSGGVGVRLIRGFSLNLFAGVSRVKNQLFVSGVGLTQEERLLRTRQLETDFVAFGSIGFTFIFGSKRASIVNTRMQSSGGFFF